MFGKRIRLFKLLGFEVRLDLSWIIIAVLVTWSLAKGLFPFLYPDLAPEVYWGMGAAGALGLFASIVFHEFCHSLVARKFGMAMKGITLFIFGGVAEMGEEPPTARAEFLMAVAGPLSSFFLSGVFYFIFQAGLNGDWPEPLNGVLRYLSGINALLAAFNLLPAFPLDGGRILRSILWGTKQDLQWATRISAGIGSGFGIVLIISGYLSGFGWRYLWRLVVSDRPVFAGRGADVLPTAGDSQIPGGGARTPLHEPPSGQRAAHPHGG